MEKQYLFLRRSPPPTFLSFPGISANDLAAFLILAVNKKEFPWSVELHSYKTCKRRDCIAYNKTVYSALHFWLN